MMSSKLTEVFNSLPPEAQQVLVEKHLVGLLDLMPKEKSRKILSAATRLQRKYNDAPKLDLRAKRKQINNLLDELARDAKVSFIKERSNRDELLSEIVHSLVSWLNDIWSLAYEHNVNFLVAHTCLLFIADALMQLSESSTLGGCKCSIMNLPVHFTLKNKNGKVVKRFHVLGPQNIDRILLWIWRDLFVSLFATGSPREKKKVPDFLEDIEAILGVRALERLLYGGRPNDEDDQDEDDELYDDFEGEDDGIDYFNEDHPCDDDDDSDYDSDESVGCSCSFHASYWSEGLNKGRTPLRDCVEKRLFDIFQVTPSLEINNTLLTISHDVFETEARIAKILSEIAGDTADNLAAALEIHIANNEPYKIASLLKKYLYLLRPRDTVVLQCAVAMLHGSPYQSRSLEILEKELDDCIRAIHATIRTCFSHVEEETSKKDLVEFLKLRTGSSERKERVQEWVERVISPVNGPVHLMAFAAMMVGLPMMPGAEDGDDADLLNYVDLDQNDPDLDDLREEYRPNLKAIFEGWHHLGQTLKGGPLVLAKLYVKALDLMPWLRGSDVVSEMANRLRERPNKSHVLDALINLSSFAKMQRKKLNLARADQQRNAANATNPTQCNSKPPSDTLTNTSPPPSTPLASPALATPSPTGAFAAFFGVPPNMNGSPPPPLPFPFHFLPGNMEDVD